MRSRTQGWCGPLISNGVDAVLGNVYEPYLPLTANFDIFTERLLRGTAHVIEEPTGRGHVVLYAEDPNYRGFWRATTRLFFNSFLFQPTF